MIKINLTCKVIQMTRSTCIAPRSTDIVSCSVCSKEQERYLFVTENDYYICVKCWLKGADKYLPSKNVEVKVDDYMKSTDQLFR